MTEATFCGHCFHSLHFLIAIFPTLCHIIAIFLFIASCCWQLGSACHMAYSHTCKYIHLHAAIHQAITVRCTQNICKYKYRFTSLTHIPLKKLNFAYISTLSCSSFILFLENSPDLSVFMRLNGFIVLQEHNLSSVLKCSCCQRNYSERFSDVLTS